MLTNVEFKWEQQSNYIVLKAYHYKHFTLEFKLNKNGRVHEINVCGPRSNDTDGKYHFARKSYKRVKPNEKNKKDVLPLFDYFINVVSEAK
ncbi:gp572 [Bacillus phage G]|uniref:Gp572 n=1 Tax=Bacillus phage G TaxID=2884420 RepID=G3MAV2_9CAUD|nr:gp572 [Bacillus phage G]AEO93818.1 gp572 [Bacillus phage G]